jgi:F0F1-type ATP synthase assembly protein I
MDDTRKNLIYALSLGMQFGLMVAITLAGFLLGGVYLDKWLHTTPLFLIFGVIFGFAGAIAEMRYIILPFLEKKQKVKDNNKNNNKKNNK